MWTRLEKALPCHVLSGMFARWSSESVPPGLKIGYRSSSFLSITLKSMLQFFEKPFIPINWNCDFWGVNVSILGGNLSLPGVPPRFPSPGHVPEVELGGAKGKEMRQGPGAEAAGPMHRVGRLRGYPKMLGLCHGKSYRFDDLRVALFQETTKNEEGWVLPRFYQDSYATWCKMSGKIDEDCNFFCTEIVKPDCWRNQRGR